MFRNKNLEQLLKHNQNYDQVKYFVYIIIIILSLFIFLGTFLKYNDKILTHYSENIDIQYPNDDMFCNSEKFGLGCDSNLEFESNSMKYRDSKEIETEKYTEINENIENKAPNDIDLDVTRNLKIDEKILDRDSLNSEDDQNFMNRDLEKLNKNTVIQNKDSNDFEEDGQKIIVGSDNRESNDLENDNLLRDNSTMIDEKTDYLSILTQFKRILDGFSYYLKGFGNEITEYKQLLDSMRKEREEIELIYKKINIERLELQRIYGKIIEVQRNN